MSSQLRVIAAIPNYNMSASLRTLVPSLQAQGYDAVYILDDASTDDSEQVTRELGAIFVPNAVNTGAGGARNNILTVLSPDELPHTLIHFLDADITLVTKDTPSIARKLFLEPASIGFIGGLITDDNGSQSILNYGPKQSLAATIGSVGTLALHKIGVRLSPVERVMRRRHLWPFVHHFPDTTQLPARRAVHWVLEGNFFIMADRLQELGGFDGTIREHDIQPLATAAQRAGYINYFDPSVVAIHHEVSVRSYNRAMRQLQTEWYLAKKDGLWRWLTGGTRVNH